MFASRFTAAEFSNKQELWYRRSAGDIRDWKTEEARREKLMEQDESERASGVNTFGR